MAISQVETVNTGADKAKLAVVALLVVAAVAGFYLLSKQGAVAQWAALVVGLVAAQSERDFRRILSFNLIQHCIEPIG